MSETKLHPLLEKLPKRLKDPANFEDIQKAIIAASSNGHTHKKIAEWARCEECQALFNERGSVIKKQGFKSPEQYAAWRSVHAEIRRRFPTMDWKDKPKPSKDFVLKDKYPPNYKKIAEIFDLEGHKPVFPYGKIIYNPHKEALRPDQVVHEKVHQKQQGKDPKGWWDKYLVDREFRMEQEIEAYAMQYKFIKGFATESKSYWFLDQLAILLSSPMYAVGLDLAQARSKIRNRAKQIEIGLDK